MKHQINAGIVMQSRRKLLDNKPDLISSFLVKGPLTALISAGGNKTELPSVAKPGPHTTVFLSAQCKILPTTKKQGLWI